MAEDGHRSASQAHLHEAMAYIADGVVVVDDKQQIVAFGGGAQVLFGYAEEEILGRPLETLIPERFRTRHRDYAGGFFTGERDGRPMMLRTDLVGRRKDGSEFPVEIGLTRHSSGGRDYATAVVRDVTLLRARERQLARSEHRFRALTELSSEWYFETDDELRCNLITESVRAQGAELDLRLKLGRRFDEYVQESDNEEAIATFRRATATREPIQDLEWRRRDEHGGDIWRSMTAQPMFDDRGRFQGYCGVIRDITRRKRDAAELQRQATHDLLTGLPNRKLLRDRLVHALRLARRHGEQTAVMMLDLDNFKDVNDGLGHEVGDDVLIETARRLRETVRPGDTVARHGGDEFVIVLEALPDHAAAATVAQKLLAALEAPIETHGQRLHLPASIGIAISPDDGDDDMSLLRNADAAMYRAKALGRNRLYFFTQELNREAARRIRLKHRVADALAGRQFILHFQPIHAMDRAGVVRAEALLRWRQTDGSLLLPAEFIPVAEDSSLIVGLDAWVLRALCAQQAAWREAGVLRVPVAANISARLMCSRDLVALVEQALSEYDVAARWLTLEVTETSLLDEPDIARRNLDALAELGVRTSLDDFGTGYSSLAHLRNFRIGEIKIDRSFVGELFERPSNAAIVRAVIALSHELGLSTVAEGVEDEAQLKFLQDCHCGYGQGYYFSKPLPEVQFREQLGLVAA